MISGYFLRILLIVLISSCSSFNTQDTKDYEVSDVFYPNGEISTRVATSDTFAYKLEFDTLGRLIDSIPYNSQTKDKEAVINGVRISVKYGAGYIQHTTYQSGVKTGSTWANYLRNDSLYFYGNLKNGKQNGQWYFFDSLGLLLDYKVYDNGQLVYYRRYNEDGLYKEEGDGIVSVDLFRDDNYSNELFSFVEVSDPPSTMVSVEFSCSFSDNDNKEQRISKECLRIDEENRFRCALCDTNKFESVQIKWSCIDSTNNTLREQIYNIK